MNAYALLNEFVPGTRVYREPEVVPKLPIVQNGPTGTSIVFADGTKVPLPTDQIVFAEDGGGVARVGFGGMSAGGMENGQLVFYRVRDLQPAELLSPQRGRRMTLEPRMVASIAVDGQVRLSDLQWRAATEVISLELAQLRRQVSESSGRRALENATGSSKRAILVFVAEHSLKSRKRVLEVEDDPDIREMVSELLLSEGYEVVSAVHGKDAIEKMEGGFSPDVILLDLMMPVLNGFDVLRVLHRTPRWSSIPVVIVSAKQGYDAVDLGTAAIIRKPLDPDVLLNTLRRLLSRAPATIPQ